MLTEHLKKLLLHLDKRIGTNVFNNEVISGI